MDGPGAHFLDARREISLQAQQFVGRHNQAVQTRLGLANFGEEHFLVLVFHIGHFGLHLGADRHHRCVLRGGVSRQAIQKRIVFKAVFCHVGYKHRRLGRDQEKLLQQRQLFLAELNGAYGFGFIEHCLAFFKNGHQLDGLLVARARRFGHAVQGLFNSGQIGQTKFCLNHLNVRDGVNFAGHVNDVVVFKAAHHIDGGIGLADMGQKLVAQAFARAGACNQPGNVNKFNDGPLNFLRAHNRRQQIQTGVRNFNDTHIGLNRTKRVILSRNSRLGQGVEQGGFSDVRQAYDAALQTHDKPSKSGGKVYAMRTCKRDAESNIAKTVAGCNRLPDFKQVVRGAQYDGIHAKSRGTA